MLETKSLNLTTTSLSISFSQETNPFLLDSQFLTQYLTNFYKKHSHYPSTKLKFYKYGRLLGRGAFGKVNLCLHILSGHLVAIKSINKQTLKSKIKNKIFLETKILKKIFKLKGNTKIFEIFETKKHYNIVMEYISGGDLLTYIKKRNKLSEKVSKFIFKQIILSLKDIHNLNIVHRDVKLDNILIDINNTIKLCDFGVSKILEKDSYTMREQCGTPAYIAPEILSGEYKGFSCDVWSSGVVLYSMLSGNVPFKGKDINDLHENIKKGNFITNQWRYENSRENSVFPIIPLYYDTIYGNFINTHYTINSFTSFTNSQ